MKRLIIYIVGLIVAISSQAQISLKDLVNIPIDTIGPKGLVIDSAAITRSTIPEIRSTHSFDGELQRCRGNQMQYCCRSFGGNDYEYSIRGLS